MILLLLLLLLLIIIIIITIITIIVIIIIIHRRPQAPSTYPAPPTAALPLNGLSLGLPIRLGLRLRL
jgi:heme/copper-type cytochrome/quinol oxidase subunit 2